MTLNNNPIFLTQKRLVHRGGILAAILIASLVGLSLLSGLIGYLAEPVKFTSFESPQDAGKMFYGWIIAVEIVVLIIGGFIRISRILGEERKAGLWDSNRLTPLKPGQLVAGYWFGTPLREFYMSVILAAIGLVIVLLAKLPFTLWLGSQVLIITTALFLGLAAVLLGLILNKPQNGIIFVVLVFFFQMFSFVMPRYFLTDFLLPIFPIANLFVGNDIEGPIDQWRGWVGRPEIFGYHIYPVVFTLGLQLIIGIFLWRVAVRKTADPFRPPLLRWEAVMVFAILLFFQHGLIWERWYGQFPHIGPTNAYNSGEFDAGVLLPVVHAGTMALAVTVLVFVSLQPERIRVKAMRLGIKNIGAIFPMSSVFLALVLTVVAAAILFTQFVFSIKNSWLIYLIAVGNLLSVCLVFSLLLEFCRLRFGRRGIGFVVLWLFVLCLLPFILAAVFGEAGLVKFSLLSPGCAALVSGNNQDPGDPITGNLNCLLGIVVGHLFIALLLFLGWQREWKKLLARAA